MFFSFWSVKPIGRFLNQHAQVFERAVGYVLGVGMARHVTPCAMNAIEERLQAKSTEDAWGEYKNSCLARPANQRCPWPIVTGRIGLMLGHELLAHYVLPRAEPRRKIRHWGPADPLARFTLRVNSNHLQKEKDASKQSPDVLPSRMSLLPYPGC